MSTKRIMAAEQHEKSSIYSSKKYKETKKSRNKDKTAFKKDDKPASKPHAKGSGEARAKTRATSNPESKVSSEKSSAETENRTRKEQKKRQKAEKKANKRPVRRIFPIWLRLIVIPLLCVGALFLGLMVGYGVLGDGNPTDALHMDIWQHIIDIVKKQ